MKSGENKQDTSVGVDINYLLKKGKEVGVRTYGKSQERILKYLKQYVKSHNKGLAQNDVARALKISNQQSYDGLKRLVKRGLVVKLEVPVEKRGIYRIIYIPTENYNREK